MREIYEERNKKINMLFLNNLRQFPFKSVMRNNPDPPLTFNGTFLPKLSPLENKISDPDENYFGHAKLIKIEKMKHILY